MTNQPAVSDLRVTSNGTIFATFNRPMAPSTINTGTFTVSAGDFPILGTVTYDGTTASFVPQATLPPSTTFTATITTGARDLAGQGLARNYAWSFATDANLAVGAPKVNDDAPSPTTTLPSVTAVQPADMATGVLINSPIKVTFNAAMNPSTITASTVTLTQGTTPVPGAVTYSGTTGTFTPTASLTAGTTYTGTVTTGAKNAAGTGLAANYVWSFTTGVIVPNANPNNQKVVLGTTLIRYAVLAGSTVTNTGPTIVNGDLGVSPGSFVTGFGPGTVNGATHAADPDAATAKQELTTAFNDAAGRSGSPVSVSGNLGGRTLTPGLYTSSSSLAISSGDLTFDALGDANAVFVIQMASTLTTTSGRQVILAGGAKAANIFWQVGSSATLGTTSIFKGNILADISITLKTGATLDGRALTRTGAVAMDSNTITVAN